MGDWPDEKHGGSERAAWEHIIALEDHLHRLREVAQRQPLEQALPREDLVQDEAEGPHVHRGRDGERLPALARADDLGRRVPGGVCGCV